jgi:hypothetical protein
MSRRHRNVLREIRRGQRDPYRVHLKSVAPHSRDPRQLLLPSTTRPAKPAPAVAPWPEHQVDLEEYIAVLPPKEKP